MKLAVDLAVPSAYHAAVDVDASRRSSPTVRYVTNCSPAARVFLGHRDPGHG